jgi:sulfatase modifying factor 1
MARAPYDSPTKTMRKLMAALTVPAAVAVLLFSSAPNDADAAPALATAAGCPEGMVEVDGDYYPVVEHLCAKWVDGQIGRDRCEQYRAGPYRTFGRAEHKHFCIDKYEWPNKKGQKPVTAQTWEDAKMACAGVGKRLCKDTEWTLACEGPERSPYPYGATRDSSACNIDKPYIQPNPMAYSNPETRSSEVARLDQREPSGSREGCVSGYGVHDMTGNVDEWVFNEHGKVEKKPYISGLKGGYWGPVRNRCRPMTTDHNQWDSYYQMGFRCCSDPGAPGSASRPQTGSKKG